MVNLENYKSKKVSVTYLNGDKDCGVIAKNPKEDFYRFQFASTDYVINDLYDGYPEDIRLVFRRYTEAGIFLMAGIESCVSCSDLDYGQVEARTYVESEKKRYTGYSSHYYNIVDIRFADEPEALEPDYKSLAERLYHALKVTEQKAGICFSEAEGAKREYENLIHPRWNGSQLSLFEVGG